MRAVDEQDLVYNKNSSDELYESLSNSIILLLHTEESNLNHKPQYGIFAKAQ